MKTKVVTEIIPSILFFVGVFCAPSPIGSGTIVSLIFLIASYVWLVVTHGWLEEKN